MSSSDRCGWCGVRLVWAKTGRPAKYCGAACRQRAWRARPRQLVLDDVDQVDDDEAAGSERSAGRRRPGPDEGRC